MNILQLQDKSVGKTEISESVAETATTATVMINEPFFTNFFNDM